MKQNIIYHRMDLDGFCSAAIVKMHLIRSGFTDINMIGFEYGDPSPLPVGGRIFLVDISLEESDMKWLAGTPGVVWYDHHKSAMELSKKGNWDCINGERKIGDSASLITWKALFPHEEVPDIVYWVDRYDVWKKKSESGIDDWATVLAIQLGMKHLLKDPCDQDAYNVWDNYINNMPSDIVYNGNILYQFIQDQDKITAKRAFDLMFEGHKFCAINAFGNSEVAKTAARPDHDGIMLFRYDGSSDNWSVSLYGTGIEERGAIDLSVFAMRYGGGGHAGACGFRVKDISTILAGNN